MATEREIELDGAVDEGRRAFHEGKTWVQATEMAGDDAEKASCISAGYNAAYSTTYGYIR
jgi:hypothetical protein